ncbi:MAG TPA: carbohydrate ABC transporter substrate-binding protein [Christensenellaceae bacterium]|jgi:hypothetical protein|nr:carbohydrate ABC transporter substrate-binding protein [Christensenellaceae bacterium]
MRKLLTLLLAICFVFTLSAAVGIAEENTGGGNKVIFFGEDDYLSRLTVANNKLYLLFPSGLYEYTPEGNKLITDDENVTTADFLISGDGKLYAISAMENLTLREVVLGEKAEVKELLTTDNYDELYLINPVIKDGFLYFNISRSEIIKLDITTGETKSLNVGVFTYFDVMEDGNIILLREADDERRLDVYNPDTGENTLFGKVAPDAYIGYLLYDSSKGSALMLGLGNIYEAKNGEEAKVIYNYLQGDVMSAALYKNGVALLSDDTLIIRDYSAPKSEKSLTLLYNMGRGHEWRDFILNNPDTELNLISAINTSSEERFINDMVTKSDTVDVFILKDTNLLSAIKNKGYFTDLSENDKLKTQYADMYPAFMRAFGTGDKIAAFPKECFIETLCYNKQAFEEFNLTVPETYDEFFDLCINWLENPPENSENYIMDPFMSGFGVNLENMFLTYCAEMVRNDKTIDFSGEDIHRLLEKYRKIEELHEIDTDYDSEKKHMFYTYALSILDENSDYGYMPLKFYKENTAAILSPMSEFSGLEYFVVNPYSKNAEDTYKLILSYDGKRETPSKAVLYTSVVGPIENPYYKEHMENFNVRLEELKESLEKADDFEKQDAQNNLDDFVEYMSHYERTAKWELSESASEIYRGMADMIYIESYNPFQALIMSEPELMQGADTMPIDMLLGSIDSKIKLLETESK